MPKRFGLSESTINKINETFFSHSNVEQAILYGSRATGNFKPGSDIDIVLKGAALTLETLNKIENELEDLLLPYSIDISIYHQIDNAELLDHIERVGITLYEHKNS